MHEFTPEEKELIVNTEITEDCFNLGNFENFTCGYLMGNKINNRGMWYIFVNYLEFLRQKYNETKDERYWKELISLLPNSYKVVKL